jgi:hypothetical protein
MNLLRLFSVTGDERYRERAEALFSLFSVPLARAGTALPRLLCALDYRGGAAAEIVLAGEPGRPDFESLRRTVFAHPGLNGFSRTPTPRKSLASLSPLVNRESPRRASARVRLPESPASPSPPRGALRGARWLISPVPSVCRPLGAPGPRRSRGSRHHRHHVLVRRDLRRRPLVAQDRSPLFQRRTPGSCRRAESEVVSVGALLSGEDLSPVARDEYFRELSAVVPAAAEPACATAC